MNKILKATIFVLLSYLVANLFVSRTDLPEREILMKALFVLLLVGFVIFIDGKKLAYFGFKKMSGERLVLLLSILGAFVIHVLFHGFTFNPRLPSIYQLLIILFLAFLDEVLFCGYAQNVLQESLGRMEAIIVASLLFCLFRFLHSPINMVLLLELLVLRLWLSSLFSTNMNLISPTLGRFTYIILGML